MDDTPIDVYVSDLRVIDLFALVACQYYKGLNRNDAVSLAWDFARKMMKEREKYVEHI